MGEIYLISITMQSPLSYFLFVNEQALGKSDPYYSACMLAEVALLDIKPFVHYCYYHVQINFQQYIILAIIVAKGIIFNTFILGYVYVRVCV